MKLYNTLSRQIEEIQPLENGKIKLFVCGPTVYDLVHIGNAKTYVQFDVLARVLRAAGYAVFYLQNITDIDDKIIARAKEKETSWDELRTKYEAEYMRDMESLNNTAVTEYARATDYIPDIIRQVQTLMDKGRAYKIDDGIYFEIATFKGYGKLSGRTEIKENDAETRIDQSDKKRGWNDFCLWKFSKPDEPVWEAPFGKGRPGWHIEDTAITEHHFGPQYDIHGGAVDLIFPHHEAEITQMESVSGKVPFVRHWIHTGFLNVDNAKMSKSAGNFHTIRDVLDKGYSPMALRLLMLQTHYRSPINFTWDNLEAAQNRLRNWQAFADLRFQPKDIPAEEWLEMREEKAYQLVERPEEARILLMNALHDDLNTPESIMLLDRLSDDIQILPDKEKTLKHFTDLLKFINKIFGLNLLDSQDIIPEQKGMIEEREIVRNAKNWTKSDQLRDQLKEQGIDIRDTPNGPLWSRL